MATTTNKGYELITTGTESGTWGDTLNTDVFTIIDTNLGGVTTKTLTSSNVVLSDAESQSAILRLTGTISANIQITTLCKGFFFVENLTTGSFTVTITNGVSGVTAPQSTRTVMIADATNGCRVAVTAEFPAGTQMSFFQTLAPTGWTKGSTHDNKAIRLVTGTASTGGTTPFTDAFDELNIIRTNLPNVTINTTADGSHNHTIANAGNSVNISNSPVDSSAAGLSSETTSTAPNHTHSISLNGGVAQVPIALDVEYVDAILATKA